MSARSLHLKQRLARGETTFGAWLSVSNPNIAEIMAGTGYDWVLIDAEHGPFGLEGLQVALMAFKGSSSVPIVRVAWNDPVRIKQVLDIGADGILVPMVGSAAEARAAVAACKYRLKVRAALARSARRITGATRTAIPRRRTPA